MVKDASIKKIITATVLSFFLFSLPVYAVDNNSEDLLNNDFTDGYIRLLLNRKEGTFSLYYLNTEKRGVYEPLFYARDPATSFISVFVDDIIYKPATSRHFETRIERDNQIPSLIYESVFLLVKQAFTPVKTSSSNTINGVQVTISLRNKLAVESFIGLRVLIDTSLGEEKGRVPFITNNKLILNEQLISGRSGDLYWISRGNNNSLMGSIANPVNINARRPDLLHFANWKRLSDAEWELDYVEGRKFNFLPYSVNDSAVAYFYRPVLVKPNETLTISYFLTTADPEWYKDVPVQPERPLIIPQMRIKPERELEFRPKPETMTPETMTEEEKEIALELESEENKKNELSATQIEELLEAQRKLDGFLSGDIDLDENDLFEIERIIQRIKENGQ